MCVREREGGGGSTQKEKVQEEWAQCYQHVLLFFHLFVHYQHIKHYLLLTSLRLGQLSGVWMDSLSPGNRSGVWSTKPMKLKWYTQYINTIGNEVFSFFLSFLLW